jgi:predicted dehydrogenase
MQPVKIIVIGAGNRGTTYATYAEKYPGKAQVVGVAEPRNNFRNVFSKKHNIPAVNIFSDWKVLAEREKFADAVFITTQDSLHKEPAIAFANKGYHILLEKPMAPNEDDCREITKAVLKNNKIFVVCHILRYNKYTQSIKSILDAGTIGDIVTIQHLEPVGYWHQAHSYVRGNWRSEKVASFMLLTKSCHDLDWLN